MEETTAQKIRYTTINHEAREKLGLTMVEYAVADYIYNLSNNPKSKIPGWCYASKESLGKTLGITKRGINKIIAKLVSKGLVETKKEKLNKSLGNHLRITIDWYNTVIIKGENNIPTPEKGGNKVPDGGNKVPTEDAQRWEQSSHNKDIYNKDIYNIPVDEQREQEKNISSFKRTPPDRQTTLQRLGYFLEDTLHTRITNWKKQAKAVSMMLKAGYTEEQIRKVIVYMNTRDDFFCDKGFDLMTVANQIGRYKAQEEKRKEVRNGG